MARNKDDLLGKIRFRELALMTLIGITAVLANLPHWYVASVLGIDQDALIAVLGCAVIISLFLYLRFFLFLAVVLLIAGANMPEQIAAGLHISKIPLLLALVAMVGVSLTNSVVRLLPTGLEPKPKEKSPEGIRAMFYAIEKSNPNYARKVLAMNFDPNLLHDNGYTPLAYAAIKGSTQLVEVFLRHGADPAITSRDGDTPVELALRFGHPEVAELLRRARRRREARVKRDRAAAQQGASH